MSKAVRYEIDPNKLPPLTREQEAEIERLSTVSERDIDHTDVPELNERFWENAVRNPFLKPAKTVATVHVDADVMAWLKSGGKGYQDRLNAILRDAMLRQRA